MRWLPTYSPILNVIEIFFHKKRPHCYNKTGSGRHPREYHWYPHWRRIVSLAQIAEQAVSVPVRHSIGYFCHLQTYLPACMMCCIKWTSQPGSRNKRWYIDPTLHHPLLPFLMSKRLETIVLRLPRSTIHAYITNLLRLWIICHAQSAEIKSTPSESTGYLVEYVRPIQFFSPKCIMNHDKFLYSSFLSLSVHLVPKI